MLKKKIFDLFFSKPKYLKHYLMHRGAKCIVFETKYGDISVPINSASIINTFLEGNYFGEETILQFLELPSNAPTLLNVGANVGTTARVFSAAKTYQRISCFEPHPENFKGLKSNIAEIQCAEIYNLALGAEANILPLNVKPDSVGRHSFKNDFDRGSIDVQVKTIADFVDTNQIFDIFMDVEGWEIEVIKGAGDVLKNCHKCGMEWNGQIHKESEVQTFIELLSKADFDSFAELVPGGLIKKIENLHGFKKQADIAFIRTNV